MHHDVITLFKSDFKPFHQKRPKSIFGCKIKYKKTRPQRDESQIRFSAFRADYCAAAGAAAAAASAGVAASFFLDLEEIEKITVRGTEAS